MYAIMGLLVRGCGSDHFVGIYLRVSPYLNWIEQHVWPDEGNFNIDIFESKKYLK